MKFEKYDETEHGLVGEGWSKYEELGKAILEGPQVVTLAEGEDAVSFRAAVMTYMSRRGLPIITRALPGRRFYMALK